MHSAMMIAFQLVMKIYIIIFLANMIALYLSLQLITYCSISETNLDAHHAEYVIIMIKNFMHVYHISFLLNAFDEDSDQTFNLIANKIISCYNHDQETSELIITQ